MTATPSDSTFTRRLHGSSLLFRLFPLIRSFLVPALLVFFLSADGRWQLWLPLLILPAFLVEFYRTRTLRYSFEKDELVIITGRWFHNERHIPYVRIQNIDLVQGPLHRLLDVGEVRLETASGSGTEAKLIVLSRSAEKELREAVAKGRHAEIFKAEAVVQQTVIPEEGGDGNEQAEGLLMKSPVSQSSDPVLRLGMGELMRIAVDP
ncbi:MAG: PH domain-containing protein, partial [Planctomycetes bacterium]|nr:PH domain-containing protein [Planctomycetota bacterium]